MDLVATIETWPGALLLKASATAYILVNAAHILSIGLIIGGILPLDLRLMGLFISVPLSIIGPFLSRSSAAGVGLAIITGAWLFSVSPSDYLNNTAFLCKMALLALALVNVMIQHLNQPFQRALRYGEPTNSVRILAAISASLWISVLIAGRWIGFL